MFLSNPQQKITKFMCTNRTLPFGDHPHKIVTIMEDGTQIIEPKDLTVPLKRHTLRDHIECVSLDAVFQFRWMKADSTCEEEAINDVMNRAVITPTRASVLAVEVTSR